jgi:hypothetical protein
MLRWVVSCAAIAVIGGCAGVPRQTRVMTLADVEMSTDELRQRAYELGHREEALIEEAMARIFAGTRDVPTRRAAMHWALAAVPAVEEATLRPEPLVALIDLWALAVQTGTWAREGPGSVRLGESRRHVEQAARQMIRECEQLAALVVGRNRPGKLEALRERIESWAAENPITSPTFARPSASVAWSKAFAFDERSGPGSFIATTDERLAMLGQRVAMLNSSVMTRMRWTIELLAQDALGQANATALVEEGVRGLSEERHELAADIAHERDAAVAQLESQRAAFNAEMKALLAQSDARARALIDRALVGFAVVGAALILLLAFAIWFVRRARRKPPGKKVDARMFGARAAT